jgi:hypothetical protein
VLKIPDMYEFRHPKLVEAATQQLKEAFKVWYNIDSGDSGHP